MFLKRKRIKVTGDLLYGFQQHTHSTREQSSLMRSAGRKSIAFVVSVNGLLKAQNVSVRKFGGPVRPLFITRKYMYYTLANSIIPLSIAQFLSGWSSTWRSAPFSFCLRLFIFLTFCHSCCKWYNTRLIA